MKTAQLVSEDIIKRLQIGGVVSAYVFGSVARGEARPDSDLDLLVRYRRGISLFDVIDLRAALEAQTGRSVDLVAEDAIKPSLYRRIKADLVKLY